MKPHTTSQQQRGAVLFLAMIFLVLLTILALTASSTSIMQERMVGGLRNRQLGLFGTETMLRGAEEVLWNLNYDTGTNPLPPCIGDSTEVACAHQLEHGQLNAQVQRFRTSTEWLDPASDGGRSYPRDLSNLSGGQITANIATQPRFIVEKLGSYTPASAGITDGGVFSQKGGGNGSGGGAGNLYLYRITARSQGGTDAVVRVAESYFVSANLDAGINSEISPP
jgi:type IV pilus assembly protein PilX